MSSRLLAVALVALVALVAAAPTLGAQSAPPVTPVKRVVSRATEAVEQRTATQSAEQAAATAQPAADRPAGPRPAGPASRPRTAAAAAAAARGSRSPNAAPAADSAGAPRDSLSEGVVLFTREIFHYDDGGRRDPFLSLLASGDLRPMLQDLKLVGVVYDPTGRRPIAVMRDMGTKDQYRVTLGQQLGRMRVTQIQPKSVIFTIEEFGYSRQEMLVLGDSTGARTP